jgi:hypothetical protein
MGPGQAAVLRFLWLFLFAASVPVAISGLLRGEDWLLLLGFGMGVVALFIRRFAERP